MFQLCHKPAIANHCRVNVALTGQDLGRQPNSDVRLVAELEDGTVVRGETHISASRAPIRRLHLEPEQCLPLPEVLKAIRTADVITVGPGSPYTSILPNLLVSRGAHTIRESQATKIFSSNLITQP